MRPIFVGWIGEEEEDPALVNHVRRHLALAFGQPVLPWSAPGRPRHAFDARRRQHASGAILRWLVESGPPGGRVLGITDRDLFIPILTYVFGEAQLGGGAAVVSTARLSEGLDLVEMERAPGAPALGRKLLVERLAKEAVHEVGHTFGLLHCSTEGCVMGRSPALREVDEKSSELCGACRAHFGELEGEG
jgi:archaemetzincin